MEEITNQQKEQLKTWAIERDAILLEISNLNTEKEKLAKSINDLGISGSEIHNKMNQEIGIIKQLKKDEKEFDKMITTETLDIVTKKNKLESSVLLLNSEVSKLMDKKELLIESIKILEDNKKIKEDGIKLIDKISNKIITVNNENLNKFNSSSTLLIKKVKEIIGLSTKNIEKHNVVLDKIPSLFVELHRKSLDREVLKKIKHK